MGVARQASTETQSGKVNSKCFMFFFDGICSTCFGLSSIAFVGGTRMREYFCEAHDLASAREALQRRDEEEQTASSGPAAGQRHCLTSNTVAN